MDSINPSRRSFIPGHSKLFSESNDLLLWASPFLGSPRSFMKVGFFFLKLIHPKLSSLIINYRIENFRQMKTHFLQIDILLPRIFQRFLQFLVLDVKATELSLEVLSRFLSIASSQLFQGLSMLSDPLPMLCIGCPFFNCPCTVIQYCQASLQGSNVKAHL